MSTAGTLANKKRSGFVRTPPDLAVRIGKFLLSFPHDGGFNVYDPTSGEGDFFYACAHAPAARYFGSEISSERAAISRQRWPRATIVTSAFEVVSMQGRVQLLLTNAPYFFQNGKRAPYRIGADAGEWLQPGGIHVSIFTARSDWDGTMINHWLRWYDQVRVWKFPDRTSEEEETTFEDYTQICVAGIRRATPNVPGEAEKKRLQSYQWKEPAKPGQSGWKYGEAPPELPTVPIAEPYHVPPSREVPRLVVRNADEAQLLYALDKSGAHLSATWQQATTWPEEGYLGAPAMPYTGEAHIASEVMIGGLDGEIVYGPLPGPGSQAHLLTAFVGKEWVKMEVDDELVEKLREQGCIRVEMRQLQDKPILGVLNLHTGRSRYYQGEEVFQFLQPWIPTLASRVIERRKPLYRLDPALWEVRVLSQFGTDKRLPNAEHAGLAVPQLHRVFAMCRSLDVKGRTAIQGEPGTGKTRLAAGTAGRQAYRWRHRSAEFRSAVQPAWVRGLRRAWLKNPRARALLGLEPVYGRRVKGDGGEKGGKGRVVLDATSRQVVAYREVATGRLIAPEDAGPRSLPVLITTPLKVTREYGREIRAAFPQAEVVHIESHRDIPRWLEQCASSTASVVFGIFSHSTTRAFGREWKEVVREKQHTVREPVLNPPADLMEMLEPVREEGGRKQKLVGYRFKDSGKLLTRDVQTSYFYCMECGGRIDAVPGKLNQPDEDDRKPRRAPGSTALAEDKEEGNDKTSPVTSRTWFTTRQRWCRCPKTARNQERRERGQPPRLAALWQDDRTKATNRKHPPCSFATWSAAMSTLQREAERAAANTSARELVERVRRDESLLARLVEVALVEPSALAAVLEMVERVDAELVGLRRRLATHRTELAAVLVNAARRDQGFLETLVRGAIHDDGVVSRLAQVVLAHDPALRELVEILLQERGSNEEFLDLVVDAALHCEAVATTIIRETLLPDGAFAGLMVDLATRDLRSLKHLVEGVAGAEEEVLRLIALVKDGQAQLAERVAQAARRDGSHRVLLRLVEATRPQVDWQPVFFRSAVEQARVGGASQQAKNTKRGGYPGTPLETQAARESSRGMRLAEADGGPIVVEEPDLDAASSYEQVRDEALRVVTYQLGHGGRQLYPIYGVWSRRVVGYVSSETGKVVTKKTSYDFRRPPADSFSPYQYLYDFFRGCVALSVVDESHNGRGRRTDIAHSHHFAMLAAQARELTSGTHFGGDILGFYHYWFRYHPQFWLRLGFGWNDAEKALSDYGVVQEWTKEYESDARKGSGRTDVSVSTIPSPGLSANLIPGLLEDLTYLTVLDVGAHMPPKQEIPKGLSMKDPLLEQATKEADQRVIAAIQAVAPVRAERAAILQTPACAERQVCLDEIDARVRPLEDAVKQAQAERERVLRWVEERDLAGAYGWLVKELADLAAEGNSAARLAQGTVPRWFAALPCESPFRVYQSRRGDWGDKEDPELVIETPVLAWDWLYPMERWFVEEVRAELAAGRRVMVYFEQNAVRSMAKRLEWVLKEFNPWTLPNGVEAEDRQQAIIEAVEAGARVVIVPYLRVNEGLNLQRAIDTILWTEMPKNLFLWTQASQRAWRLGKENLVKVLIPYYIGSAAHRKVRQLGERDGAAAAFAGEPARGGLVQHVGADQTTLARLSAQIEAGELPEFALFQQGPVDDSAEIEANFARRNEELAEALRRGRQWFGMVDTLSERLAAVTAAGYPQVWSSRPQPVYLPEVDPSTHVSPIAAALGTPPPAITTPLEETGTGLTAKGVPPASSAPMREAVPAEAVGQPGGTHGAAEEGPTARPRLLVVFGNEDDIMRTRKLRGSRPRRTLPRPKNPTSVRHIPAFVEESNATAAPGPEMVLASIWDGAFSAGDESEREAAYQRPIAAPALPVGSLWDLAAAD